MKAKLVKYPFDEKKYRWDTWKQGKEFEYTWDESLPNNFETIEPYIEFEDATDVPKNKLAVIDNADTDINEYYKKTYNSTSYKVLSYQSPAMTWTTNSGEADDYSYNHFSVDRYCHIVRKGPTIYTTTGWLQDETITLYSLSWYGGYDEDAVKKGTFVVKPTEVYYKLKQGNDGYLVDIRGDNQSGYKLLNIEQMCLDSGLAEYKTYQLDSTRSVTGLIPTFIPRCGITEHRRGEINWDSDKLRVWRSINTYYNPTEEAKIVSCYNYGVADYYYKTITYDNYFLQNGNIPTWAIPYSGQSITQQERQQIELTEARSYVVNNYRYLLDLVKYVENLPDNASIKFDNIIPSFTSELIISYDFNRLPTTSWSADGHTERIYWDNMWDEIYHSGDTSGYDKTPVSGRYSLNYDKYHMAEYDPYHAVRHYEPVKYQRVYTQLPWGGARAEYRFETIMSENAVIDENFYTQNTPYGWRWRQAGYLYTFLQDMVTGDEVCDDGQKKMLLLTGNNIPSIVSVDYFSVIRVKNFLGYVLLSRNLPVTIGDDFNNTQYGSMTKMIPFNAMYEWNRPSSITNTIETLFPVKPYEKLDEYVINTSKLNAKTIRYLCDIQANYDTLSAYMNGAINLLSFGYKDYEIKYDRNTPKITITSWNNCANLMNTPYTQLTMYADGTEVSTIDPYSFGDGFLGFAVLDKTQMEIQGEDYNLHFYYSGLYYEKYNSTKILNGAITNKKNSLLINLDDWNIQSNQLKYWLPWSTEGDEYFTRLKAQYNNRVYLPSIRLIGDRTDNILEIEEEAQDIPFHYILGEGVNGEFVPKPLQINAPVDYELVEIPEGTYSVNTDTSNLNDEGNWRYAGFPLYGDYAISRKYGDLLWYDTVNNNILFKDDIKWQSDFSKISPTMDQQTVTIPDYGTINVRVFSYGVDYTFADDVSEDIKILLYDEVFIENTTPTYLPKTTTALTFNSYTLNEWLNGYHFTGKQWNNYLSPFAYINNITSQNGNKTMTFTFEECPAGKYQRVFSMSHYFEVNDNLDNSFIALTDEAADYKHYFDDNVGGLWYFGTGTVSSTDRHAYPDEGSLNYHAYRLRPQDTRFLRYFRERVLRENIELFSDRYTYTHNTVDFCNRSYEGTICGTTTSTGEENIPDGTWREYMGLYLGETIPFLHITEAVVPPSEILGVPQYDKQVNTSDTLKYGTVASASLSFTLNKPVNDCLTLNNQLLVLYYDFKNTDEWERLGFMRVDTIEALDEYSTSLLAHDETYKLNKYVDDFLEAYTQSTTLDLFYRDLLDYCGCFYDTHQEIIHNGNISMTNVYHAVKTTGIQVAHYIAILVPGFIHTNIDGDIVLSQYEIKDNTLTVSDYNNLVYCAYNTDMIDKVKITSSNAIKGESAGSGENVYFLADDPLLSELQATSYFNDLADGILAYYNTIPAYRPATIDFFILPRGLAIGDIVNLTTPKNENYSVIIMRMSITSSGIQVQSFGTQNFPVEAESNSEFVNLINDMGEISGDVSNMLEAQRTMANAIADNAANINQNSTDISSIITKNTEQDNAITTNTTNITNLQTLTNGYGVTVSNNLATINLNGTTSNITNKTYVDSKVSSGDTATLNSAKAYADSLVGTALTYRVGTIRYTLSSTSTIYKTCHCMFIGTNDKRNGLFIPTEHIDGDFNKTILFRVYNGAYYRCYTDTSDVGWFIAYNASFTED